MQPHERRLFGKIHPLDTPYRDEGVAELDFRQPEHCTRALGLLDEIFPKGITLDELKQDWHAALPESPETLEAATFSAAWQGTTELGVVLEMLSGGTRGAEVRQFKTVLVANTTSRRLPTTTSAPDDCFYLIISGVSFDWVQARRSPAVQQWLGSEHGAAAAEYLDGLYRAAQQFLHGILRWYWALN